MQVPRHLVHPGFKTAIPRVEAVPVTNDAVEQILCKIFAGTGVHCQLQKKIIYGRAVPVEQLRQLRQLPVFYPVHDFLVCWFNHA